MSTPVASVARPSARMPHKTQKFELPVFFEKNYFRILGINDTTKQTANTQIVYAIGVNREYSTTTERTRKSELNSLPIEDKPTIEEIKTPRKRHQKPARTLDETLGYRGTTDRISQ